MKAFLLFRERDLDWGVDLQEFDDLMRDLGLEAVLATMAAGDRFLYEVARHAVLTTVADPEAIEYRQLVLRDCLAHPEEVRDLYALASDAVASERRAFLGIGFGVSRSPELILHRAVAVLELLLEALRRLRAFADAQAPSFESDGFRRFFAMVAEELTDEYLDGLHAHLKRLEFRRGVVMSARLGTANKGVGYLLRRAIEPAHRLRGMLVAAVRPPGYSFHIAERDEAGARALSNLRDHGLNSVANAAAQSTDHVLSFFGMLRSELGFYVGCLNLHAKLSELGAGVAFPEAGPIDAATLSCRGLCDAGLVLRMGQPVVGNDIDADGKTLLVITGANQGGKSTFVRSLGLAQLMTQAGMFVVADAFRAGVRGSVVTHFLREEDETMTSGKLDEELARMSKLVDQLRPDALVLFNESFSATNEREGSQIARQIIRALRDAGVRIAFVTHMYDLAYGLYTQGDQSILFLRAERLEDERRTFKVVEAEPERTSHGEDVYRRVFALDGRARAAQGAAVPLTSGGTVG